MQLKRLFHLPESKYRIAAVLSSLGLGVIAFFLGFSVAAALFDLGGFLSAPGSFFVQSYGVLAFIIPTYLIYAAFLLAAPGYRPDRIFILASLSLPFLTLALGVYWVRNYSLIAENSPFFAKAGKAGISFVIVITTVIEGLLITLIRSLLFTGKPGPETEETPADGPRFRKSAGFLPAPRFRNRDLADIYTESAAQGGVDPGPPLTQDQEEPESPENSAPAGTGFDTAALEEAGAEEEPAALEEEGAGIIEEAAVPEETDPAGAKAGEDADVARALAKAEEEAARHGSPALSAEPKAPSVKTTGKKRQGPYSVPVEGILKQYPDGEYWIIDDATRNAAITLKETLKEFSIHVEVTGIRKGPVITMFEILPAPGIRLVRIEGLADNIALRLAAQSVRIVAPIPGKHAVGIEVPNARRNIVSFREIIEGELRREGKKPEVPVVLGKDITGEAVTADLVQMPHLLIAGATGSGKSVCVNAMILSILYQCSPRECRLILIDPKIVELKLYNDIPHLLTPVITEPKRAFQALQYCIYEMERRYACLDSMGVRDIRSYNKRIKEREIAAEYMPYIVVVIDEFADLMATTGKELESTAARLAAMSRAVGIHLVLATQRPSIDVITGLIKANIPSRIAFMVASKMDSRIIIDMVGAEKLLGKGDMLYAGAVDPFPIRMQGAFVSEEEVERVVDYVKSLGEPDYIDDEIFYDDEEEDADPSLFSDGEDPLYEKALEIVLQQGKASASYIQRRLKIGYNRAARLVEEMEHHGVVGPAQGSKPRELLRGV
ncbi:MAG: DNA translocase FtsK [Treponema sp.]|nr:DNA translocase FtsK [Treponema sp.]